MVRDGIYTEHRGEKQLRELHDDLSEVLGRLIEVRGMEAMVDLSRTSVRVNIFVAPTECEVGLRVRYHVPVAPGSTRSIMWCVDVKDMDVDAQTVTLERDKYNALAGCIWAEERRDVPVSCLSAMGVWRNDVVLIVAASARTPEICFKNKNSGPVVLLNLEFLVLRILNVLVLWLLPKKSIESSQWLLLLTHPVIACNY